MRAIKLFKISLQMIIYKYCVMQALIGANCMGRRLANIVHYIALQQVKGAIISGKVWSNVYTAVPPYRCNLDTYFCLMSQWTCQQYFYSLQRWWNKPKEITNTAIHFTNNIWTTKEQIIWFEIREVYQEWVQRQTLQFK